MVEEDKICGYGGGGEGCGASGFEEEVAVMVVVDFIYIYIWNLYLSCQLREFLSRHNVVSY